MEELRVNGYYAPIKAHKIREVIKYLTIDLKLEYRFPSTFFALWSCLNIEQILDTVSEGFALSIANIPQYLSFMAICDGLVNVK